MSKFGVEIVRIAEVTNHPHADRLDIVTLDGLGYRVVSAKGQFVEGDVAVYFPVDSVLPQDWVKRFGIEKFYHKRITATKIRGVLSEGLLVKTSEVADVIPNPVVGANVTEVFGVTKYETPIPISMQGEVEGPISASEHFPDIENIRRFPNVLKDGEEVVITEKLHGTNFCVWRDPDGDFHVGSHNYFWKINAANSKNIYVRAFAKHRAAFEWLPQNSQVFGEIFGDVQDLKYGMSKGQFSVRLFAAKRNGRFLDYNDFVDLSKEIGIATVPLLYRGPFYPDMLHQYNNAKSTIGNHIMEGVVITPAKERSDVSMIRVCLKYISEAYLLRKGGTELH